MSGLSEKDTKMDAWGIQECVTWSHLRDETFKRYVIAHIAAA
jgi:hypothetical protein